MTILHKNSSNCENNELLFNIDNAKKFIKDFKNDSKSEVMLVRYDEHYSKPNHKFDYSDLYTGLIVAITVFFLECFKSIRQEKKTKKKEAKSVRQELIKNLGVEYGIALHNLELTNIFLNAMEKIINGGELFIQDGIGWKNHILPTLTEVDSFLRGKNEIKDEYGCCIEINSLLAIKEAGINNFIKAINSSTKLENKSERKQFCENLKSILEKSLLNQGRMLNNITNCIVSHGGTSHAAFFKDCNAYKKFLEMTKK